MKRLARAVEAWIWTQVIATILALTVIGTAAWVSWQVVKNTARVFGL